MKLVLWTALGLCAISVAAETAKESASGVALRLELRMKHAQGAKTAETKPHALTVCAGEEKAAKLFIGDSVTLRTAHQGMSYAIFKDTGVWFEGTAQAASDGRYRLDLKYEQAAAQPVTGEKNPTLSTLRGEVKVVLGDGETAELASLIDPVTGDVVTAEVSLRVLKP